MLVVHCVLGGWKQRGAHITCSLCEMVLKAFGVPDTSATSEAPNTIHSISMVLRAEECISNMRLCRLLHTHMHIQMYRFGEVSVKSHRNKGRPRPLSHPEVDREPPCPDLLSRNGSLLLLLLPLECTKSLAVPPPPPDPRLDSSAVDSPASLPCCCCCTCSLPVIDAIFGVW